MSNYFFLFKNTSSELVRVRVKGSIAPKYDENYMTNLFEDFKEHYLDDLLSKSSTQISTTYRKKINQCKIFFKNQFTYINQAIVNSEKYTKYDNDEFKILVGQIDFLFDEVVYGNKTNKELDQFKVIVEPTQLLEILDSTIDSATSINQKISDNYNIFIDRDKELLEEKNTLLLSRDPSVFNEIIQIIKEREKISYLLLDLDVDITNSLIELSNLKYLKLRNDDLIITLQSIKNHVKIVRQIVTVFKQYDKKYLS
jgi:hypothetical protein